MITKNREVLLANKAIKECLTYLKNKIPQKKLLIKRLKLILTKS